MRRISIFGSTGSIGVNTVDLVLRQGGADTYDTVALTGSSNIGLLAEQARTLRARVAVTADPGRLSDLRAALAGTETVAMAGPAALIDAAEMPADWVMSAIVGAAGLAPTLAAARHGTTLALANKESLVCAGALLLATCASHGTRLLPVDSEHSAVFQAIGAEDPRRVERILLTASGGPFRTWSRERMRNVTPAEACAHPNWTMGQRISIDSATMFNKALELIEAHVLFGVRAEAIEVVVHPQSIVHSMVGFSDGSIIAQLGPPDMRGAIGYALNWPERAPLPVERLDFARLARLDFEAEDRERFPSLGLARRALAAGGLSGAVLNAAKEVALDEFLAKRIGFLDIAALVAHVLAMLEADARSVGDSYGLDTVLDIDQRARDEGLRFAETMTERTGG
ncbi:MAG: 1-deoxy-D-xylulose-5-phosphate reductoisomerase [Pseudomonadota bacterium]